MAAPISPAQWLALLMAGAAGISGWIYGWQWKRVATGGDTTQEERLIIDLQDQLDRFRAENESLVRRIHELEQTPESEAVGTPAVAPPEEPPPPPE